MELKDDQIELLQELINHSMPDIYEAMAIIPDEYIEYFDIPTIHGQKFKSDVLAGAFKSIKHVPPVPGGNNHQRYILHGFKADAL